MRRGEVWWGEDRPPVGRRPFLILSRDGLNEIRNAVTAAPVTTRIRGVYTEVPLGMEEGLSRESVASLADMTSMRKTDLFTRIGEIDEAKMRLVEDALRYIFDMTEALPPVEPSA